MKQTLPDFIAQNENLRQLLLSQEGGIMKYLAEHLDAKGTAALFCEYQNQCVDEFFEKNKWNLRKVWAGDEMRRAALGEMEHLWKEVRYQRVLKSQLAEMNSEASEMIEDFTEQYLTYAYIQNRKRRHPDGMTPIDVYQELIGMYNTFGLAYKCMEIILKEHHAVEEVQKTESELFTEFQIRQYSNQLTLGVLSQIRQAVAEMVKEKDANQCQQMAIDTLVRLRGFSQMVYTDEVVRSLLPKFKKMAEQRKNDGKWLRDVADRAVLEEYSAKVKNPSMRFYFADFVNLLKDVSRIWAAQLLVRGIDMKVLEKSVCCILKPSEEPHYYVDCFYTDDLPNSYCVSNDEMAEKLLYNIYGVELPKGSVDSEDNVDSEDHVDADNIGGKEDQHGSKYYGEDFDIFHENLNPIAIADAVKTLPRGEVRSNRKFFLTVYSAFDKLNWLTSNIYTKFISWMKYHSGIHFETNDFKNLNFDEDMETLLPQIIAVFSDEVDDNRYIDKEDFYRKDQQGNCLAKINKG